MLFTTCQWYHGDARHLRQCGKAVYHGAWCFNHFQRVFLKRKELTPEQKVARAERRHYLRDKQAKLRQI